MAAIRILDKLVAELIAAGEVVERPASVVKELVENAMDAGAGKILVEIRKGGIGYIRITDDGCGIPRADLPLAFVRHATSKVFTQEDLLAIGTFGFRGEALASVAAMAKVELLSRTPDQEFGSKYIIHGGEEISHEEAGCPVGTTIVVRDLFYNTPARMKFLKKDTTEGMNVSTAVEKLALANPNISFTLIKDGERKLSTPGNGDLLATIHALFGREVADTLIPVEGHMGPLCVKGYISRPQGARASRSLQNFFVNTRYVRSKTLAAALEESYQGMSMVGKFPACVLDLQIPFDWVDVNVHPAKIEVRFSDERGVYDCAIAACKQALSNAQREQFPLTAKEPSISPFALKDFDHKNQQQHFSAKAYREMITPQEQLTENPSGKSLGFSTADPAKPSTWGVQPKGAFSPTHSQTVPQQRPFSEKPPLPTTPPPYSKPMGNPLSQTVPTAPTEHLVPAPSAPTNTPTAFTEEGEKRHCRVVGEVFTTYILVEYGEQLVLVDKHAAHERILYNALREQGEPERQLLLAPIEVRLARLDYDLLLQNDALLQQAGFAIEDFGEGMVVVREAPMVLSTQSIAPMVEELAVQLQSLRSALLPEALDSLYHSIACRGAIKAGDKTPPLEREQLISLIQEREDVRHCPHGRPVVVSFSKREIEKLFGRLNG